MFESIDVAKPKNENDRRVSDRFPIAREVCYRVHNRRSNDECGSGVTMNMSSNGVLFTTEQMLLPGKRMEMAVNWPARLDNRCALKFVARGRVVRSEEGTAAVEIDQYEFRTLGSQGLTI
jgi:PilZ domain